MEYYLRQNTNKQIILVNDLSHFPIPESLNVHPQIASKNWDLLQNRSTCRLYKIQRTHLLQEVSSCLTIRAAKSHGSHKIQHTCARALVNNLAFCKEDEIIEKLKSFGRRLEQWDNDGVVHPVRNLLKHLRYLECSGAVQTSGDLVHEENLRRSYEHLRCGHSRIKASMWVLGFRVTWTDICSGLVLFYI